MKLHWALLVVLIPLAMGIPSSITTESLVVSFGYPFEEHTVETSDGYLLTIHRIPYSSLDDTPRQRPVAFLMHGLLSSSSDWVLLGPNSSLVYILSDAGYDVWLGNARGNTYSRDHIKYNPRGRRFWDFEWHEIGMIDLPATIDYILLHTGEDQVRYFGHSQGTTIFFLLNSLNLNYKTRIKSAHLFAPAVFMNHMESPIFKVAAPILGQGNSLVELFGSLEFLPQTKLREFLGYTACLENSPVQDLCSNVLFLVAGYDADNLNRSAIPDIVYTYPAGASVKQVMHYMQEYLSGDFREFDYGLVRNLLAYGSRDPPSYPIEKIEDLPIFLYYGKNDLLISEVDVLRLCSKLSNSTLRRAYEVPHPKWNHIDFLWGLRVREEVYDVVMEDIASIN